MRHLGSLLAGGIVGLLCVRRAVLLGAALLPARPLAEAEDVSRPL